MSIFPLIAMIYTIGEHLGLWLHMLIFECFKHNIFVMFSLIIDYSHGESSFLIFFLSILCFLSLNIYQSKSKSICVYPQWSF